MRELAIRWRTVPFRVLASLVGVYVTYLVVVNAALASGALKLVLNHLSPSHARFDWSSAYSPWFSRVHAKNFVLRGEDSSVQWRIAFDRVQTTFVITDLVRRRVHMYDAQARGVSVRIRFKIDPAQVDPVFASKLPALEGFSDPPLKAAVLPAPPADANYHLWTIALDDVAATDVREVWVDDVRVTDTAGEVVGGFYLKPLRRIGVRPTRCQATDAKVVVGSDVLASSVNGTFGLTVDEFDMREPKPAEILRLMDARARIRARLGDLAALSYLIHSPTVKLAGGAGALELAAELDRGVIVSDGHVRLRSDAWRITSSRDGASSTSFVEAFTNEHVLHASIESYDFALQRDRATVVRAPAFGIAVRSHDIDVTKSPERWNLSFDVPAGTAPELTALNAYFDEPVLPAGSANFRTHVDLGPHIANAKLDLHDVNTKGQTGWWANVLATPVTIAGGPSGSIFAVLTGKIRDARLPLLVLDAPGIVSLVFGLQSFTFKSNVRVSEHGYALSDAHAVGDSIEIRAHYKKDPHGKSGAVLVSAPLTTVGLDVHDGKSSIHPFVSRDWYDGTLHAPNTAN